jgi:hypothetical protein
MDSQQRTDLLTAYAIERQDDSSALTVAFAISTTGLTYVIAATAFFGDRCNTSGCENLPTWLPLAAPSIAVAFVGFLLLNVTATRMRSVHIQRIEDAIRIPLPTGESEPSFHTDAGLVFRPDRPFEKPRIRLFFAVITTTSYAFIIVALIGFTWVILTAASGPWTVSKYVVAVGYGSIEVAQLVGFVWSLKHERFVYKGSNDQLPH